MDDLEVKNEWKLVIPFQCLLVCRHFNISGNCTYFSKKWYVCDVMWQLKGEEKSNKILKIKVLLSRENQLVKDSSGSINVQRSWLNITEFKPVGDEEEKKSLSVPTKTTESFMIM